MLSLLERGQKAIRFSLLSALLAVIFGGGVTKAEAPDRSASYIIFSIPVIEGLDDGRSDMEPDFLVLTWPLGKWRFGKWRDEAHFENGVSIHEAPNRRIQLSHIVWCEKLKANRCEPMYFRPQSFEIDIEPGRIYYLGLISITAADDIEKPLDRKRRVKGSPSYDYAVSFVYSKELLRKACVEKPEAFASRPVAFPFFDSNPAETYVDCSKAD